MKPNPHVFIASSQDAQFRLDKLLPLRYPEYSRSYFQFLFKKECIWINGKHVQKKMKPRIGDTITVHFLALPQSELVPEEIPLDILFEDESLLVINKPPGIVVHPAPGHAKGTIVNALLAHCKTLEMHESLRPGIVHRLDQDTSGLLLLAKTASMHQKLVSLFAMRKIKKTYLALCIGCPNEGWIDAPLKRHPIRRKEIAVLEGGKEAKTHVRILQRMSSLTLVELTPLTGRTHQLRVHLKHVHTPILGDAIYGNKKGNQQRGALRQMLHAWRLEFSHPCTAQPMVFSAPCPEDFHAYIGSNTKLRN
jgi:23S rRNA pseudouridine1911/1915/1917 synthase